MASYEHEFHNYWPELTRFQGFFDIVILHGEVNTDMLRLNHRINMCKLQQANVSPPDVFRNAFS